MFEDDENTFTQRFNVRKPNSIRWLTSPGIFVEMILIRYIYGTSTPQTFTENYEIHGRDMEQYGRLFRHNAIREYVDIVRMHECA